MKSPLSKVTVCKLGKLGKWANSTSGHFFLGMSGLWASISCSNAVLVQLISLYIHELMATCEVVPTCLSVTFEVENGRAGVL